MDLEEQDLGWHYDGFYTFIDTQSYQNLDGFSSDSHSESLQEKSARRSRLLQEKSTRRSRLIKISVFWMVLFLLALIIFIIYISHHKDSIIRYYTSEVTLTIKQDYTATLANKNSLEYRELTSKLCFQMENTFKRSRSYGSTYQFCEVKNLRPGSIIGTSTLYFTDTIDVTNEEVYRIINSSITVVNSTTMFGEYVIDTSDISISTTITVYGRDPLPYLISNSVFPFNQIPSSTVSVTTVETTSTQSTSGTTSKPSTTSGTISTSLATSGTISTSLATSETISTPSTTSGTISSPSTTSGIISTPSTTSGTIPTPSTTSGIISTPSTTSGTISTPSTTSGTISTPSTTSGTISTPTTTATHETTSTESKSTSQPSTTVTVQASTTTASTVQNNIPFSTTVQKTSSQSTTIQTTLKGSTTGQTTQASSTLLTTTKDPSTNVQTSPPANQTILQSSTTVQGDSSTSTEKPSTRTTTSTSPGTVETASTTKTTSTLSSTAQSTLPVSSTAQTSTLSSTAAQTTTSITTAVATSSSSTTQSMTTENTTLSTVTTPTATETKEAEMTTEISSTTKEALTTTAQYLSTSTTSPTKTTTATLATSNTSSPPPPTTTETLITSTTSPPTTTETLPTSTTSPPTNTRETLSSSTTSPTTTTETLSTSTTSPPTTTTVKLSTSTTSPTTLTVTTNKLPTSTTTKEILTTTSSTSTTTPSSTTTTQPTSTTSLTSLSTSKTMASTSITSPAPSLTTLQKSSISSKSTSPTDKLTTSTTIASPTSLTTTEILASASTTLTSVTYPSTTQILTTSSASTTRTSQSTALETLTTSSTSSTNRTETTTAASLSSTETTSPNPFSISSSTFTQFTETTSPISTPKPTVTTTENTTYTNPPTQMSNNTNDSTISVTVEPTTESTTETLHTSSSNVTTSQSTTEPTSQTTQSSLSTTNTTGNSTLTTETSPGTTTMVTETTTGYPVSTANMSFPSVTVLARKEVTLECTIDVVDNWDTVSASRELNTGSSVLAEYSSNGTESHPTSSDLTSVTFNRYNDRITVVYHVKLATANTCPSLLRFRCGITMADVGKTVIMSTSDVEITAPVNNVTLDMKTEYYSGERVELTCRTTTDFEYGFVTLEVRLPDGSMLQEPARRSHYKSARKSDCSVDFEWNYRTTFPMEQALNGSVIRCIASNTLLNKTALASEVVIVMQSDVSFTQYHVTAKPGKSVSIQCQTSVATSAINSISIYKISNNTNVTIATYDSGVTTDSPGRSAVFQNGSLTVEYNSLQCADEGQYFCTVTSGSAVFTSPLPLTMQPTVEAGSSPVSLSLHVDLVEHAFHYTSVHSCSGEVGYPDVNGFLSLTISNPTTGETATYNEKVIPESMKVFDPTQSLYLYSVPLADGLVLLVKENATRQEDCSSTHTLRFYLNVSREWNNGKIKCEIQKGDSSVQSSMKEETLYVIPADACERFNDTKIFYIDHDKFDNCNTYIQCENNKPYGRQCNVRQCVYIGKQYCDDCSRAICTENPTTSVSTTSTSTLSTTATKAATYVECTSSSVYQNELASISCHLNVSTFQSLNVSKEQFIIATIWSDGTVTVSPEYSGKLVVTFSLSVRRLDVTIPSMSCSNDGGYSVEIEIHNGDIVSTTFSIVMKVKPSPPLVTLKPDLRDGLNQMMHSCTGNVGHPVGKLEIQIKRLGEPDFKNYHPANQKRVYSLSSKNCTNVQTMNFSIDLSADSWTNVTIRCVAFNSVSLNSTETTPSSTEYTISSIPSDYCSNSTFNYYDQHPMGCPFYVWCVNGIPYGYVCATKSLCINTKTGHCDQIP